MGRDTFHQTRLLKAPSNLALNPAKEGAATASLGNLGQGLTTLRVKNFFLISHLNLPSFSLKPLSPVLSLHGLVKVPLQLSCRPLQVLEGCSKVSPQPSLLQAEQPQLSQPFLTAEVLQPSDNFCGLLWIHSNRTTSPELDTGLQVGSQSRAQGQNPLPCPAAQAAGDAAQGTVGFLGCENTLPAHAKFKLLLPLCHITSYAPIISCNSNTTFLP